ncbi:hypothetical protein B0H63DRAFT_78260 [Podospora didyma]|uniref:Uncharacterized protein n=1 Tax=Podospora didyma TaxID=330526 RepID=A0AAE0N2K9_9PEZI|nr:hypothetical protein B0H63DRAFT_78260 [Podospora didyma]
MAELALSASSALFRFKTNRNGPQASDHTTTFSPVILYWTRIRDMAEWREHRNLSMGLFSVSIVFQTLIFALDRASGRKCGWMCYLLLLHPLMTLPWWLYMMYLVHKQVPLRTPANKPRERWLRLSFRLLYFVCLSTQLLGNAVSIWREWTVPNSPTGSTGMASDEADPGKNAGFARFVTMFTMLILHGFALGMHAIFLGQRFIPSKHWEHF